ncbi:MAG: TetR/AcrR family transcriptional regulator [Brachybacterium tyrofermentans]|uniref:TetR/AcrR family transcriptional regulator n=1 Tax=Brachybacterium tyrofermentans TaxID=47848 RepID=UPI003F8EC2DC
MSEGNRPYHHGDLRAALVAEGLELTRSDGPGALSLREVTRRAGVSPAAAYRHFRDRSALLGALGLEIQSRVVERMRARTAEPGVADPAEESLRRLRGVGLGYIDFACEEPGWFEMAFFGIADVEGVGPDLARVPPFAELLAALDECVATGALPAPRRPGAEFSCWSAVHGCAELIVHGPLRGAAPGLVREVAERVVDDIIVGIR